jgi:hypothetical protein
MAGDYTRFTYRPEDDHSAVLMQQGRAQLDADWNELVELAARRLRVETVDVIGRCGVPRQTLQGFKIGGTVSSGLTIGVGRCYVDGLLAENRGTGTEAREPVWGERIHGSPTPYLNQPYLRPAPNPPGGAGPHLAYLDVWERELTAAEDPALVEPALGADTATRLQTVWAVRFAQNVGAGTTCDSDWDSNAEWQKVIRPSGARLTSGAQGPVTPADPCHVAPAGGYRGVDNRLYRVEVHDDGSGADSPSFKWSRDNGAIAAELRSMSDHTQTVVTAEVRRVGRDGTLRFKDGDWVELTDDQREIAGLPGVMAKIAVNGVDAQANELTLEGPLDAKVDPTRHARVRKWDQQAAVDPLRGVIPIGTVPTATPFELEHGVKVSFDLEAPGTWHVGDYWVFAARAGAEEGTVEELKREPPRGIRHHYCRLAVIDNGAPTDCRVLYPPEAPEEEPCCDCDICVSPESHADGTLTIQDAIDKVKETGGKVCLAIGTYRVEETIRIWGARSLRLAGKGIRTVIEYRGDGAAIDVYTCAEVTIDHLAVATSRGKPTEVEIGLAVRNSIGVTVERCLLGGADALAGLASKSTTGAGKAADKAAAKAASKRAMSIGIGLAGFVAELSVRENALMADFGVAALSALGPIDETEGVRSIGNKSAASWRRLEKALKAAKIKNLQRFLVTHGVWIEDNLFACGRVGVDLGRGGKLQAGLDSPTSLVLHLGETRIAGNALYLCTEAGIVAAGIVPADRTFLQRLTGGQLPGTVAGSFDVKVASGLTVGVPDVGALALVTASSGARLEIVRNELSVTGWGIVHGCDQTRVAGNDVGGLWLPTLDGPPSGGGIAVVRGSRGGALTGVEIVDNRVRGMGSHGIAVLTGVEEARVCDNTIEAIGGCGIFTAGLGGSSILVARNQVFDVGRGGKQGVAAAGILVSGAVRADIEGNQVDRVGGNDLGSFVRAGIVPLVVHESRVTGNVISDLAPNAEFLGWAPAIVYGRGFMRALVDGNHVRLFEDTGTGDSLVYSIIAGHNNIITSLTTGKVAGFDQPALFGESFQGSADNRTGSVMSVHGNILEAASRGAPLILNVDGSLAMGDNVCRQTASNSQSWVASIVVRGAGLTLTNNHFYGPGQIAFIIDPQLLSPGKSAYTAVGNIADGQMLLRGAPLPTPWKDLNVEI